MMDLFGVCPGRSSTPCTVQVATLCACGLQVGHGHHCKCGACGLWFPPRVEDDDPPSREDDPDPAKERNIPKGMSSKIMELHLTSMKRKWTRVEIDEALPDMGYTQEQIAISSSPCLGKLIREATEHPPRGLARLLERCPDSGLTYTVAVERLQPDDEVDRIGPRFHQCPECGHVRESFPVLPHQGRQRGAA